MNKFAVALAAAGLTASLGAYAALPTDAPSFGVNIPNLTPGLQITLEGLLLQPTNSDLDYATVSNLAAVNFGNPLFIGTNQDVQNVNPHHDFGFRVALGYTFPDSGNDVQLSWTHFNNSTSNDVGTDPGDILRTGFGIPLINFPTNPFIDSVVGANTDVSDKLDAIDLDVGQYVNLGTRLQTRFFGGLRFASVRQDVTNQYGAIYTFIPLPTVQATYAEQDEMDSKFDGLGPRFGVDATYHIASCFGIVGHISGALLVGKVKSDTDNDFFVTFTNAPLIPPINIAAQLDNEVDTDDSWRVVPELDAKVGLNYTFLFDNKSNLTLELGWQATEYFDAVDQVRTNVGTVLSGQVDRETSSIGYQGPYLSLNYKM